MEYQGMQNIPVYPFRKAIAFKYNQVQLFEISNQANHICCKEIEDTVKTLSATKATKRECIGAIYRIYAKYGPERMNFILAMTVRYLCNRGYDRTFTISSRKSCRLDFPNADPSKENTLRLSAKAVSILVIMCNEVEDM